MTSPIIAIFDALLFFGLTVGLIAMITQFRLVNYVRRDRLWALCCVCYALLLFTCLAAFALAQRLASPDP